MRRSIMRRSIIKQFSHLLGFGDVMQTFRDLKLVTQMRYEPAIVAASDSPSERPKNHEKNACGF